MATSRRVSRVSSLIKREVSQMLLSEIKDDRVGAGMVSVTNVEVSGDLQHAKIFVSIYGTSEAKAETMAGLHLEDRSLEQGDQILQLLNNLPRLELPEDEDEDDQTDVEIDLDDDDEDADELS